MAKEGSTVSGLMDTIGIMTSMALQYGVPMKALVDKFSHTRFEPSGFTNNPKIPMAKSVTDYVFRYLGNRFLPERSHVVAGRAGERRWKPPGLVAGSPWLVVAGGSVADGRRDSQARHSSTRPTRRLVPSAEASRFATALATSARTAARRAAAARESLGWDDLSRATSLSTTPSKQDGPQRTRIQFIDHAAS